INGFAYCKMLFDDQERPVDLIYLAVNNAFEKLTGFRDVVGKNITDVVPGIKESSPELLEIYGRVALTGTTETFEIYLKPLDMWLNISVYSPQKEYIVAIFENITERKRVENELRSSQRSMTDIIEFLPDATFAIDLEGRVIAWNHAIEKMTGVKKEEMMGQADHAFSLPFYGERKGMLLDLINMDDGTISERYSNVTRDGDTIQAKAFCSALNGGRGAHIWAKATYLFDSNGRRIGAIESIRDVTKNRQVEEALFIASDRLSLATHAGGIGVWDFDVINNKLTWDDQMFRLYGIQKDQFGGAYEAWKAGIFPEDMQRGDEEVQMALRGERDFDTEFRVLWPDGNIHHIRALGLVQRDASGKPLRMVGTNWDITERKRIEDDLRNLARAAENSPACIVITDTNGDIEWINPKFTSLTGYTLEEAKGQNPRILKSGETSKEEYQRMYRIILGGGTWHGEFHNKKKNGELYWESVSIAPIFDATGKIARFIASKEDVTERKQIEKALHATSYKLNLLSSITRHDINNQMTILQGNLSLLRKRQPQLVSDEHLRKALQAIEQMSATIQFTKNYENIGVQTPAWASPGRQSTEAFALLHPAGVELEDDTNGIEVLADPLVEKIPYNLIDNSMRHGGRVTLIKMSAEQSGDTMLLVYEDDGVGISEEDKKRLFEKGFGKNTGFGLFLCREILAITGITITETGKAGEGVRFEMLVPAGAWRFPPIDQ
ncbi:MAG: PAS domain S-box protein, partial [Methanomassiliicoccales archaeon]